MNSRPVSRISEFVASLLWDAIPTAAQRQAALAFRDTIGCMIGGADTPAAKVAMRASAGQTSLHMQAFVAAVKASALDFDDGHYLGGAIHPGSVIGSALAVTASACQADLRAVLTAQVAGYEVALRAAHLLWPGHERDRYHCTGTAATLGAAAAVAKLRGHDVDVIERTLTTAWAHAPMSTFQLPMVKESIGWSAASAVFAAELAAEGFMAGGDPGSALVATFPPTPFDTRTASEDPFVQSLGVVFESARTYFKPFAACRYTHTSAASLRNLMRTYQFDIGDVERIQVFTHRGAVNLSDARPLSIDQAQYSFPFVLAMMALHGAVGAAEIREERLHDADALTVAGLVTVHHEPVFDAAYPRHYGSRTVVSLRSGETREETRLVAPGDNDDPMSEEDLVRKFERLAAVAYGSWATDAALTLLNPEVTASQLHRTLEQALRYQPVNQPA